MSERTLSQVLVDIYGYNPFLNPTFPHSWRISWMMQTAKSLDIAEDDIAFHLQVVQPTKSEEKNDFQTLKNDINNYLLSSHHSLNWQKINDILQSMANTANTKKKQTELSNEIKKIIVDIRVHGGPNYCDILTKLDASTNSKAKLLPNIKLNSQQLAACKPLYETDEILYQKLQNLRSAESQTQRDLQTAQIPSSYGLEMFEEMSKSNIWDVPRIGRYHKVWSRLNSREMKDRKLEVVLCRLAQLRFEPQQKLVSNIIADLDDLDIKGQWKWSKSWLGKSGLIDITKLDPKIFEKYTNTTDKVTDINFPVDSNLPFSEDKKEGKVNEQKLALKKEYKTKLNEAVMAPLTGITLSFAAHRQEYKRDQLHKMIMKEFGLPLQKQAKSQVYRLIDKVM